MIMSRFKQSCIFLIVAGLASTTLLAETTTTQTVDTMSAAEIQAVAVAAELQENAILHYFTKEGKITDKANSVYYRQLLKINPDGSYLIQDFFTQGDIKQSDPCLVTERAGLASFDTSGMHVEGPLILWYQNGQKEYEANFKKGKSHGVARGWHENGQMKELFTFVDGKLEGLTESWYENGQKEMRIIFIDGKPDELVEAWYENGQKSLENHYEKSKRNGVSTEWYKNGQKKIKTIFVDDKPEGLAETWYENGQKLSETHYEMGKRHGLSTEWYENGQKNAEATYSNGLLEGLVTLWTPEGVKEKEIIYENGNIKNIKVIPVEVNSAYEVIEAPQQNNSKELNQ